MKLLLTVLVLSAAAFAQLGSNPADDSGTSVAAAAKKSRESKPATAKKVYTDDDLPSSGSVSVVGGATKSAGTPATNDNPAQTQAELDAQWHARIEQQKNHIAVLQDELKVAEANEARSAIPYYEVNNGNPRYAHYKQQADSLRQQIEDAKNALSDLQDEAHKAGANKAYD
jgi:hypothetical protein